MKTRLLINLTKSIESSKSLKEFISSAKSILNELGLPVFNINLIVHEKGDDRLLVHVDYGRIKELLPDFAFDNPDSDFDIIDLKLLIRSRQLSGKSIIFSLMRGKIVKTENVLLEDGSLSFKDFEKKQFLRDFISLSPTFREIAERYGLDALTENPDIGGIISFPVLCDQRVVGSLDLLLPPDLCVMKHEKTRLLALVTGIIGSGYKNFIYRDKASLSDSKNQALFDSTPLAIFVVDHDHQIVEANNRFKEWHPRYREGRENICYRVLPISGRDTPCPDCMVRRTFQTGRETSREISSYRGDSPVYYKIVTPPSSPKRGRSPP
jgi:PAS domain-containing protein